MCAYLSLALCRVASSCYAVRLQQRLVILVLAYASSLPISTFGRGPSHPSSQVLQDLLRLLSPASRVARQYSTFGSCVCGVLRLCTCNCSSRKYSLPVSLDLARLRASPQVAPPQVAPPQVRSTCVLGRVPLLQAAFLP